MGLFSRSKLSEKQKEINIQKAKEFFEKIKMPKGEQWRYFDYESGRPVMPALSDLAMLYNMSTPDFNE